MAGRGPIPKRSTERSRGEKPSENKIPLSKGTARGGRPPAAKSYWDPKAKAWYNALKKSGIADYYEQSDWALATLIAEELSAYYTAADKKDADGNVIGKRSSMMFASILSAMEGLGVSEGERRRMRIELEHATEPETPASVTAINDYRKSLGVG